MGKKTISKINFIVLQEEVIRQFDEQSKLLRSHTHLAEVLLGFIMFSFIYFLKDIPIKPPLESINLYFAFPITLILIVGGFGARAFWLRDFPLGMNVKEAKDSVLKNTSIDLRVERFYKILKANEDNEWTLKRKSLLIKLGYIFYFIGFIELLLVKFIYSYAI